MKWFFWFMMMNLFCVISHENVLLISCVVIDLIVLVFAFVVGVNDEKRKCNWRCNTTRHEEQYHYVDINGDGKIEYWEM